MKTEIPETLHDAIQYFSTGDNALNTMIAKRWPDGVVCPLCQSKNVLFMPKYSRWQCKGCRKQFTVKVGTIFEDSPIKLEKWLVALWLITGAKNGISSCELARSLGVTQKTAWFMLHRLRMAFQSGSILKDKMNGTVEVDESYIGGRARNMHAHVKREKVKGTGNKALTPVQGLLQRSTKERASQVVMQVVDGTKRPELQGNVRKYVLKGTEVHTDALASYTGLAEDFNHKVVDHAESYVKDGVHTNGLENFWSLLKRTIKGTYVSVEPFHLFRYLSEQVFRFNERKDKDGDQGRFFSALSNIFGKRLTWNKLTGKDSADAGLLPQAAV
jgi:transposase-like protein